MQTSARRRFVLLAALMVATCAVVLFVMTAMLYDNHLVQHEEHLRVTAESQARLIEAMARQDDRAATDLLDEDPSYDPTAATLAQVAEANTNHDGWDQTGEFTLARHQGDAIVFLLGHRHDVVEQPAPVPFDSDLAEPMRRALQGRSGSLIGLDYRGVEVLAAHEPVAVLNLGIVAKVDMEEVRAPFIQAGLTGAALVLLLVLSSTAAFFRISGPIVRHLEAHADLLGAVHRANPDQQLVLDRRGVVTHVHRSDTMPGATNGVELVGQRYQDTLPLELGELFTLALEGAGVEAEVFEYQMPTSDGDRFHEARIVAIAGGGRVVTIRDISARKQGEAERERFLAAITQTAESIVITGANGVIQYVNPAFERISGYSRDQAIGKTPRLLKSGQQSKAFYKDLWGTITAGNVWQGEIINKRIDGELYAEHMTISPVTDAEGATVNYVAVRRDTTRERELEEKLRHAQKMEAIGTLTGGIAHDFNNILHSVIAFCGLAQQSIDEDKAETVACLQEIDAGARRAADLVQQLLAFSRAEEVLRKNLYISPVVQDALKLLRSTLPTTIVMESDVQPEGCAVLADPTQLHQVVINLCTNAVQAMEGRGGALRVSLENVTIQESTPTVEGILEPGRYVLLSVADSGTGITPDAKERIFEPFFTTKEQGKGTGLGLATVHGIVGSMGGTILAENQPEGGAVFKVFLPRSESLPVRAMVREHGELVTLDAAAIRVMFVDDEASITRITKKLLVRGGFDVEVFTDSALALERFEEDPGAFSIVITDLAMPKLTGLELASRIRSLDEDIPILLVSGQIGDLVGNENIAEILRKPVDMQELVAAIHRNMSEAKTPRGASSTASALA